VVVYRATVDGVRRYLRLAEEAGQDLTTDALVLELLRALGVQVPGVVAASPPTAAFPRSWMIMAEVPGHSIGLGGTDDEARQAAMAAGRDVAVINYVHAGRYSGIIDIGEMRGADSSFDLGHFLLHDRETRPASLFGSFLEGYRQVSPLPDDDLQAICTSAILLGLRQLARWLSPARGYPLSEPLVQRRIAELSHLLDGKPARPER
jgi:hypothetical protein